MKCFLLILKRGILVIVLILGFDIYASAGDIYLAVKLKEKPSQFFLLLSLMEEPNTIETATDLYQKGIVEPIFDSKTRVLRGFKFQSGWRDKVKDILEEYESADAVVTHHGHGSRRADRGEPYGLVQGGCHLRRHGIEAFPQGGDHQRGVASDH